MFNLDNFQVIDVENVSDEYRKLAIDKRTSMLVMIRYRRSFYLYNNPNFFNLKGIVNVLSVIHGSNEAYNYTMVTEYLPNGTIYNPLKQYINSNGSINDKMNPTIKSKIIFGVAATMKRLHRNNIIHRKLLPHYVYFDKFMEPKIKLASISTLINDTANFEREKTYEMVPFLMAPELLDIDNGNNPNFASDVYQYGLFLYLMFDTDLRFRSSTGSIIVARSFGQYGMSVMSGRGYVRPNNIPDHYWNLIEQCLQLDPTLRPTMEQIVETLKDDRFALNEFGMTTDLNDLHEYRRRIDDYSIQTAPNDDDLRAQIENLVSILPPKAEIDETNQNLAFIGEEDEEFHQNLGEIGNGATSTTYKIKDTRTNTLICKKVLRYRPNQTTFRDARNAMQEFEVLSRIKHPCICKAIGINIAEPLQVNVDGENRQITTIALFIEFVEHKLTSILSDSNIAHNTLKTKIVVEVAHAMNFIHRHNMIHRDLKIENIMLNSVLEVKLVDFGLVKVLENAIDGYNFVQESLTRGVGTLAYMSPEMLNEENYNNKTDVYSFGIVLFFIFVGSLPRQHFRDIMRGNAIQMPNPSPSISQFCIDLISRCLSPTPSDRPSFEEILNDMRENSFNLASNIDVSIIERRDRELNYIEN